MSDLFRGPSGDITTGHPTTRNLAPAPDGRRPSPRTPLGRLSRGRRPADRRHRLRPRHRHRVDLPPAGQPDRQAGAGARLRVGSQAIAMARQGARVIAVDPSRDRIETARAQASRPRSRSSSTRATSPSCRSCGPTRSTWPSACSRWPTSTTSTGSSARCTGCCTPSAPSCSRCPTRPTPCSTPTMPTATRAGRALLLRPVGAAVVHRHRPGGGAHPHHRRPPHQPVEGELPGRHDPRARAGRRQPQPLLDRGHGMGPRHPGDPARKEGI